MAAQSRIYIVGFDDPVRDSLRLLLEINGLAACAYGSAAEFLADLAPAPRGCVLLDRDLAELDAPAFRRAWRGRLSRLPVIMMSGRWDDRDRAVAADIGARAMLTTPIDGDLLVAATLDALGRGPPMPAAPALAAASRG